MLSVFDLRAPEQLIDEAVAFSELGRDEGRAKVVSCCESGAVLMTETPPSADEPEIHAQAQI